MPHTLITTHQELFTLVATHLITQGKHAYDTFERICVYRHPDGLKCAIGSLIPNEEYDADMEGYTIEDIISVRIQHAAGIPDHLVREARALQRVHDDQASWTREDGIRAALQNYARDHRLRMPEI